MFSQSCRTITREREGVKAQDLKLKLNSEIVKTISFLSILLGIFFLGFIVLELIIKKINENYNAAEVSASAIPAETEIFCRNELNSANSTLNPAPFAHSAPNALGFPNPHLLKSGKKMGI